MHKLIVSPTSERDMYMFQKYTSNLIANLPNITVTNGIDSITHNFSGITVISPVIVITSNDVSVIVTTITSLLVNKIPFRYLFQEIV